ncbi:TolC family protein [Bradyrhizobium sp. Arg62]|uniref:TolC family protein n=1 Tax=Bradyrhizobium brasilense TaxID=1419277 RepID=UPI001E40A65F|nr:TolC family protein [Bradyrhizobium brasilense]MCC8948966.1 TolC family protein [Bradyrhizobium brasilense]
MRHRIIVPILLLATSALAGCASFSPDTGMGVVSEVTEQAIGKDVAFVRSVDEAATVDATVKRLLARNLTADAAVQVALLNNKKLQAAYNELALAETDYVADSLPPNPTFSVSRITGNGASEVERQVVGDILALATLPARSEIARERFRQAQLKAALATLRLAAEVRRSHVAAVAANEMVALLTDAKASAESTAQLAKKLGETGGMNKLDQAREQVFYAEITADLASARQNAASSRERLARLLGLWDGDLGFRIPGKLPLLPKRPLEQPSIEIAAVGHRVDLQIARMEIVALAKALDLAEATRFVTLLDVAGIDKRTHDPEAPPFRERGFDVQFQIPIFDGGEVRVRQAAEIYRQAMNRLTEKAINVRSEARDAYRVYRSTYDIARHYQREVLPLRQIITEEMQLRFSSMQVDVFALLTEARQRLASLRAAIDARRDFLLAQSELQTAINGGGSAGAASTPSSIASAAQPAAGGGH